jgi:hypothetical protein
MSALQPSECRSKPPESKITGQATEFLFRGQLLGKHSVDFFRCPGTGFIQTETPYWLDEAYSSAISDHDTGLLQRCLYYRTVLSLVIRDNFARTDKFLDFGGGYGVLTRLMRDRGHLYFHDDPMCENLFAKDYQWNANREGKAAMVTAFEVFEHLESPRELLSELLSSSDTVVFSTLLVPNDCPKRIEDWWYFLPETGQHVSFYTADALQHLAEQVGCEFYTNGSSLHAISRKPLRFGAAKNGFVTKIRRMADRALRG